jgi:N-acetylglutamate synthase
MCYFYGRSIGSAIMNKKNAKYKIVEMNLIRYKKLMDFWQSNEGIFVDDDDDYDRLKMFLKRNPKLNFMALHDDQIIATIKSSHDGRRGYLHHLAVKKEYRNKGLAKELVNICLERLRKIGIKKFRTFVLDSNKKAIQFWKRVGFSVQSYNYRTLEINE